MMPKTFLVEDLSVQLVRTMLELQQLRRRMDATAVTIAAQGRRIEALRKRIERSQEKRRKQECHSKQGTRQPLEH